VTALQTVQRRKLTVDEFHRIALAGVLREDDRNELIDGQMIEMAPIGTRHLAKVNRLSRVLRACEKMPLWEWACPRYIKAIM